MPGNSDRTLEAGYSDAEPGRTDFSDELTRDKTNVAEIDKPSGFHAAFSKYAEYRRMFGDHVHKHFFNNGALAIANNQARYQALADTVDLAIIAETARWSDMRTDDIKTKYNSWDRQRDLTLYTYFPLREAIFFDQLTPHGLYPDVEAATFNVNGSYQHGGYILATDSITITAPAGTIYYTTDGTDPVDASTYSGSFTLPASTTVKARVYDNGDWSALTEAVYASALSWEICVSQS